MGSRTTDHLFLTGDHVGGSIISMHTDAVIQDTTAGGLLSLGDQALQVCNVNAGSELVISDYAGSDQAYIGAYADPNAACTQPVVVDELDIADSKSPVYLGNVVVRYVLSCFGNKVIPIISSHVVVLGRRTGQCR